MEDAIKYVLKKTGMSQAELAEKLFVTPQAVSKWVRGESRPTVDNVSRIYEITGINVMELGKAARSREEVMRTKNLKDIDDYGKAKQEANAMLEAAGIRMNYSYPVYKLCSWLLPAVIGLTHHQMVTRREIDITYEWIFPTLLSYLDDTGVEKVSKLYENQLEYDFYQLGSDLFESFDEYKMPDQDYCDETMKDWYRFQNAVIKDSASPVYNELLVAITEIGELED